MRDGIDNDGNGFRGDDCRGYNHAEDSAGDASSGNYLGAGSHGSPPGAPSRLTTTTASAALASPAATAPRTGRQAHGLCGLWRDVDGWLRRGPRLRRGQRRPRLVEQQGSIRRCCYEQSVLDAIGTILTLRRTAARGSRAPWSTPASHRSNADYYPAYYDKTIAVAATDNYAAGLLLELRRVDQRRINFNIRRGVAGGLSRRRTIIMYSRGDWIDISAPGMSIYSTVVGPRWYDGTSMACPHVEHPGPLPDATAPARQDVAAHMRQVGWHGWSVDGGPGRGYRRRRDGAFVRNARTAPRPCSPTARWRRPRQPDPQAHDVSCSDGLLHLRSEARAPRSSPTGAKAASNYQFEHVRTYST